jgi:hypothetical protein
MRVDFCGSAERIERRLIDIRVAMHQLDLAELDELREPRAHVRRASEQQSA